MLLHRLFQLLAADVGIRFDPAGCLDHLQRVGGPHQNLRQERIGVQGDRREELIQFFLLEDRWRDRTLERRRGWRGELCQNAGRRRQQQDQDSNQSAPCGAFHRHASASLFSFRLRLITRGVGTRLVIVPF